MTARLYFLWILFLLSAAVLSGGEEKERRVLMDPVTGKPVAYSFLHPEKKVYLSRYFIRKPSEFRGVWTATIGNLDFPRTKNAAEFRTQFRSMVQKFRAAGFSALIFQVRPANDAFYPSRYNTWSRYLSGKDGKALESGFDPLEYMIAETHAAGMEFHAWLNPYRVAGNLGVSKNTFLKTLSPDNFARRKSHLVLSVPQDGGKRLLMLNPGEPEVVLFLADTVREIIGKYNVDAIHFDDYFYPYEDVGSADQKTYRKYAKPGQTLQDWRRENVNLLVRSISKLIRSTNKKNGKQIRFGISPFGIWANRPDPEKKASAEYRSHPAGSETAGNQSYFTQYADTRFWVRQGWLDYIAPQLYWGLQHPKASYASLADWWADLVKESGTDLYIGLGVYLLGARNDMNRVNELRDQLLFNATRPEIDGCSLYSARYILKPENTVQKQAIRKVIEGFWGGKMP